MSTFIDLLKSEHSYLFGFLQGDGHLYQNRQKENKGRLAVEINVRDEPLLVQFQALFPLYSSVTRRQRNTNFKEQYIASTWSICDKTFRDELVSLGLPVGKKSEQVEPPKATYISADYFRGLIDADGSLGMDRKGLPFLSLTTSSDAIAQSYMQFLATITKKEKGQRRNKRDGVYNILVWKEDAQKVVEVLYYENCLALPRKYENAQCMLRWARPSNMRKVENRKTWTTDQDDFILNHSVEESMEVLSRSRNSVLVRKGRLRHKLKHQQVTD